MNTSKIFHSLITLATILSLALVGCGDQTANSERNPPPAKTWRIHDGLTLRSASLGANSNVTEKWSLPRGEHKIKVVFEKPADAKARSVLETPGMCHLLLGNSLDPDGQRFSSEELETVQRDDGAIQFSGTIFLGQIDEGKGNHFCLRLNGWGDTELFAKQIEFTR